MGQKAIKISEYIRIIPKAFGKAVKMKVFAWPKHATKPWFGGETGPSHVPVHHMSPSNTTVLVVVALLAVLLLLGLYKPGPPSSYKLWPEVLHRHTPLGCPGSRLCWRGRRCTGGTAAGSSCGAGATSCSAWGWCQRWLCWGGRSGCADSAASTLNRLSYVCLHLSTDNQRTEVLKNKRYLRNATFAPRKLNETVVPPPISIVYFALMIANYTSPPCWNVLSTKMLDVAVTELVVDHVLVAVSWRFKYKTKSAHIICSYTNQQMRSYLYTLHTTLPKQDWRVKILKWPHSTI